MNTVVHNERFEVPKSLLWREISAERGLENYHPFCVSNTALKWPGSDALDELTYLNGRTFRRKIINWDEGTGYDLVISYKRLATEVNWRVSGNEESSSLTICLAPKFLHKNVFMRFLVFNLHVKPKLKLYLRHVFLGLHHFIDNKTKVRYNQFGEHPWFS